jgi:hypothetical protein
MSFLTPLGLLGGLLAIPIVLLYMLRLRRREVPVSSNFLWQQILLDREANTPWQRLRRNLLLLLQLLILAALVFALARPFVVVPSVSAGQTALLLDASASMNATDSADGSRFAEARRRALEIVDTMGAADRMTVIRVAEVPEVLAPYTEDRAVLRSAINGALPSLASADWAAALTLAAAGAAGAEDFNIVLVSDGGLGDAASLPAIPGQVQLVPVGQSGDNVAITALATRALAGQAPELFAQVTNYGSRDAEVVFDLRVDGDLFTAERYTVAAGQSLPLVSSALPAAFSVLQAGLTIPAESSVPDALDADNHAWAVASNTSARRVLLMSPGNYFIEQVLRSLPAVDLVVGDVERGLPNNPFDLYIFDRWLPPALPNADMLFIDPPASTPLFAVGEPSTATGNPTVRSSDPRMTFVDFGGVNVATFKPVSAAWADPLISVDGGPLLLAGDVDNRQVAVLTFNLFESDLPLQIAWPVLVSSLLDWYQPQAVFSAPDGLKVGDSVFVRPPLTASAVRVTLPDGTTNELPPGREGVVFASTGTPGVYRLDVLENGAVSQSSAFAINLFDPGESDITPNTSIRLGEVTVGAAEEEEVGQREFWPWLVAVALALLLIEWFAYHRRQRAPQTFAPLRGGKRAPARH